MVAINNARTSRSSYPLGSVEVSRTNFAVARSASGSANALPTVEDDTRATLATLRRPCDKIAPDSPRHRRRTAPGEAPPPAWVSEVLRLEPPGTDRPGGGAADRS